MSAKGFQYARRKYELPERAHHLGLPAKSRANHLKHLENMLLLELGECLDVVAVDDAREHLLGCSRRVLMMQCARLDILKETDGRIESLDPYVATRLNLSINSFYTNMVGACDNLAWAAAFELSLYPTLSEKDDKSRKFCSVTGPNFRRELTKKRPFIAPLLDTAKSWLRTIKDLRDPAAHRIPLTFLSGVLSRDRHAAYSQLQRQAVDALSIGDWDEHHRLSYEATKLEEYRPILAHPRRENGDFVVVPDVLETDQQSFLDFVHAFLLVFVESG